MACKASPWRSRYSPGAQKEVLMCRDSDRRQPRLAHSNRDSCKISLFRCMVMSERSSSGKSFKSCHRRWKKESRWGAVLCSRQAVRPQGPFPTVWPVRGQKRKLHVRIAPGFCDCDPGCVLLNSQLFISLEKDNKLLKDSRMKHIVPCGLLLTKTLDSGWKIWSLGPLESPWLSWSSEERKNQKSTKKYWWLALLTGWWDGCLTYRILTVVVEGVSGSPNIICLQKMHFFCFVGFKGEH